MHFNGQWKYSFNQTYPGLFETTPDLRKEVTIMRGTLTIRSGEIHTRAGLSGTWIELPYAGNDFAMIIIVPNQRHALKELIDTLETTAITGILKQLDSSWKKKVNLTMPKFEVGSTFSFVQPLQRVN